MALWIGAFVAFLGTTVTTFHEPLRVAAFWAYGAPVVACAIYCLLRRPGPLDGPLAAAVATFILVAWLSTDRIASLEAVGLVITYASVFVIASRVSSPAWRAAVAVGICLPSSIWLFALAAVWVVDLGEWLALGGGAPPHIARSAHMWLGTDIVAVLLLLSSPFVPWIRWRALRNTLAATTLVAAIAIVPLSDARTAWVAVAIGAVCFVALSPGIRRHVWPRYRLPLGIATVVLAAVAVVVVALGSLGSLSGRTYIWETALATFQSSPVVGTGPGTFSWARLAAAPPLLERFAVFHAHNVLLQTLADGGILLLAGVAFFCVSWLRRVTPAVSTLARRQRLAFATLAALALILMLDEPTQLPAIAGMALILAGWTAGDAWRAGPEHVGEDRGRWVYAVALGGAAVLALPFLSAASDARSAAAEGRDAATTGDWAEAYDAFARAGDRWPSRAAYQMGLGLAAAQLGRPAEAERHYEAAAELSPGDPRPLGGLAALSEDPDVVISLLGRAARLASKDPQYSFRLAVALAAGGLHDEAAREMARAAMVDPQILALLADDSDEAWLEAVLEELPGVMAAEAELAAIDVASVMAQADVVRERVDPDHPPALVALAEVRLGRLAAAQEAVDEALHEEPFEQRTYAAAIAVAEVRCDHAEAERLRRLAAIAPGGFTSLYRVGPEIEQSRDHVYREMGLGDYQPPGTRRPAVSPYSWPARLVEGIGCADGSGAP